MQCAEMRPNKDKQYVDVLAHHRLDGQTIPIRFKAEDQPAQWIMKVSDIRPGHSPLRREYCFRPLQEKQRL